MVFIVLYYYFDRIVLVFLFLTRNKNSVKIIEPYIEARYIVVRYIRIFLFKIHIFSIFPKNYNKTWILFLADVFFKLQKCRKCKLLQKIYYNTTLL